MTRNNAAKWKSVVTKTVWLPAFFKISSVVFCRKKKIIKSLSLFVKQSAVWTWHITQAEVFDCGGQSTEGNTQRPPDRECSTHHSCKRAFPVFILFLVVSDTTLKKSEINQSYITIYSMQKGTGELLKYLRSRVQGMSI